MSSDSFPGCLLELEEHAPCIFRLFLLHGLPHTSFPVNAPPSILTNMAFQQSHLWREAATSICREHESPDDLCPLRQALRLLRCRADFDVIVTMGAGDVTMLGPEIIAALNSSAGAPGRPT